MEHIIIQTIVTTLVGALVSVAISYMFTSMKKMKSENDAVKKGIQALLRAQMIHDYNEWVERGYAPIYARENFQNCWNQYELLGANGVMNDIKNKFFALPTQKKEEK